MTLAARNPSTSAALADVLAIAKYRDGEHIDPRGGPAALLLWITLYIRAGGRPGTVEMAESEMAALISLPSVRSLRGSDDSPGPLYRLEKIGAVEKAGPQSWYIGSPAEANEPRPARPPRRERPLPTMQDVDEELPAPPVDPPHIVAMPGGLRGESAGTPRGLPRESAMGGEGGDFLDSIQEEENPPPPPPSYSAGARGGVRGESAGTPPQNLACRPEWIPAQKALRDAGVKSWRKVLSDDNLAAGATPGDVVALAEFYRRHPRAFGSPGVIGEVIANWIPGSDPHNWESWPTANKEYVREARKAAEQAAENSERQRGAAADDRLERFRPELAAMNLVSKTELLRDAPPALRGRDLSSPLVESWLLKRLAEAEH